jgi:hypothetical protein
MVPMSGAMDRIWNNCTGFHWDNKFVSRTAVYRKAMSNARQSPSGTGRVSKELQLSSDLMHKLTGLGCRVVDV